VYVEEKHASVELVDGVIRKNMGCGLYVGEGKAVLRGGTISDNEGTGAFVTYVTTGGKVTVAKAEVGKPQTVSKDNTLGDWRTVGKSSEIFGIPQEKIYV